MGEVALAPVYTASRWTTLHEGLRDQFAKRPLTNANAVALIREWRGVVGGDSKLWYQFAASAYGWHPPKRDVLDTSKRRAAMHYTDAAQLFRWVEGIATELDERKNSPPARIMPDRDTFADPAFVGDVRAHLLGDGARAPMVPTKKKRPKRRASSELPLLILGVVWLLTQRRGRRR